MKTFEEILADLKTYLEDHSSVLTDWNTGSILRTICELNAEIGSELYNTLYNFLLQNYILTADGEWLDKCVGDFNIIRNTGSKALISNVNFYINEQESDFTIPAGTRVITNEPNPKIFETTEDIIILAGQTVGSGQCRATEVGIEYNIPPYYLYQVVELSGIIRVENTVSGSGGEDYETDDELRDRALEFIRDGLTRGTKTALKYGAKTVTGVRNATVRSNVEDNWEKYPIIKLNFTGTWEIIENANLYYGQRKEGTGEAILKTKCKNCKVALWNDPTYGAIKLYFDSEVQDINLTGENSRLTIEKEFTTEGLHTIKLDTLTNKGSIEYIETFSSFRDGTNIIYIDDGTGNIAWEIVRNCYNELENWVSASEAYFVRRCEIKTVDRKIRVSLKENLTETLAEITILVQSKANEYINSLKMGETLYNSQIIRKVLELEQIKNCTVDDSDITPEAYEIIRAGIIEVVYD
jgi:uncharacterized phage protein gp47/JayE